MFALNDKPRDPAAEAVLSKDLADLLVAGVVVEADAGEAESLGAFTETALTEADAWEANADLETDEAGYGK
jgi:type IV secretion system protein VirB1